MKGDGSAPDLYSHGLERMLGSFREVGDTVDLGSVDVNDVMELVVETLSSWTIYRDQLAGERGYDGIRGLPSGTIWARGRRQAIRVLALADSPPSRGSARRAGLCEENPWN